MDLNNISSFVNQANATSLANGNAVENYQSNYLDNMIKSANSGDKASIQWLANYFATKESEKTARDWTAQREDSAYQRLASDLKKAGISPYVMSGASPMVSSSSGKSYSGSEMVSSQNNANTTTASNIRSILMVLGVVFSALMHIA